MGVKIEMSWRFKSHFVGFVTKLWKIFCKSKSLENRRKQTLKFDFFRSQISLKWVIFILYLRGKPALEAQNDAIFFIS